MASYNELLALIDAYINQNGVQAITGQVLNGVLRAMVDQLGRGYSIMGAADPTTDPGTPDGPETWFASVPGTYTNFDGIQIVDGELALLSYVPSDGFSKNTIYEGFQTVQATIDGNVGTPAVGVSYANGILSFDFHNMKGVTGDPAGFGAVTASVDSNIGTPSVQVQTSGPDTAKAIAFQFHNLKGETGVTSVLATVDNTSGNPQCAVSLNGQQLVLNFTGLKGTQGDTGSSVDYPFTIVNNLTTNDATQALSAAMGVQLESEVSQLEAKVDGGEIPLTLTNGFYKSDLSVENNTSFKKAILDISPYTKITIKASVRSNAYLSITDANDGVLWQSNTGNERTIDLIDYPTAAKLYFSNETSVVPNPYVTFFGVDSRLKDSLEQNKQNKGRIEDLYNKDIKVPNIGYKNNLVPFYSGLVVGGLNDSTGAESVNTHRLRTGYIAVNDTKFFKVISGNWDCEVLCYKYENDSYTYLGYIAYIVDGVQEYRAGTTHIRLYINNPSNQSLIPTNEVSEQLYIGDYGATLVTLKDIEPIQSASHTKWIIPSLDIAREKAAGTFWNLVDRSDSFVVRIPITGNQTIYVRTYVSTDASSRRTLAFNASGVRLDYYNGQATERSINVPANTAYMDFTMDLAHINDVYVKDSNGNYLFKYSPYGEMQTRHNQAKIRVGQWNVGAFDSEYYYEGGEVRKETHTTDELISLLRGLFTELQADIVILNEYNDFLDEDETASAYEQVLKQFYPYIKTYETIETAPKIAVASRFPLQLSNEYYDSTVRALVGTFDIGFHNRIGLIATHLDSLSADNRITQAGLLAPLLSSLKFCICGGDMNTGNNGESAESVAAQMSPFTNAGYTPSNRGYWGAKPTYYQPRVALDNIYARGINVVNYQVLESRPGSDHNPTYADITLWE